MKYHTILEDFNMSVYKCRLHLSTCFITWNTFGSHHVYDEVWNMYTVPNSCARYTDVQTSSAIQSVIAMFHILLQYLQSINASSWTLNDKLLMVCRQHLTTKILCVMAAWGNQALQQRALLTTSTVRKRPSGDTDFFSLHAWNQSNQTDYWSKACSFY